MERRKSDKIWSDKGKAVDFLSDELFVYLKNMQTGYLILAYLIDAMKS